jgi:hypothetical protein
LPLIHDYCGFFSVPCLLTVNKRHSQVQKSQYQDEF